MYQVIRKSGLILPKNYEYSDNIILDLTRNITNWDDSVKTIKFYEEFDDYYLIPRYYDLGKDVEILDETDEGEDISIESNIKPISERQKKVLSEFKNRNCGILQLEPGVGKTVLMIDIISFFKKKTIIFAHKDKLLDQWKDEFLKHTNISEDQIGRLTTHNYKECLKKSIILSTPHVVLYSLNNNKKEFIEELQKSNIGILVIDECHVGIGPEQFTKISIFINAKRTYGLSATPYRGDGSDDLLEKHLGPVFYYEPAEGELLIPDIFMYYFDFNVFKHNYYFMYNNKFQLSRYYMSLYKSEEYNKRISEIIKKSYEIGRTVLVLGKNIKPLLVLAKLSQLPKSDVGIFIPGVTGNNQYKKMALEVTDTLDLVEAFYTKKVVFSTYGACRDGNNRKDLDMLIMSCPTTNPEQAIGRILRKLENKKKPIVIDIVDKGGPLVYSRHASKKVNWFLRSSFVRYEFYRSKRWNIKVVGYNMNDIFNKNKTKNV